MSRFPDHAEPPCTRVNPETFYPKGFTSAFADQIDDAKTICATCPWSNECLADQLDWETRNGVDQWAVIGGTTPAERSRLHQRGAA